MRVLVCGGRDYKNREMVYRTLHRIALEHVELECVIHGCAPGADSLSGAWARAQGVKEERYPANWNKYGKAAGPIRNQYMLDMSMPDVVVAFPGGRGTADMVKRAKDACVPVVIIEDAAEPPKEASKELK